MDMVSLPPPCGPPGGDVMSIEVPTFLALATGRDLDSRPRPGTDACGELSGLVGVKGLFGTGLIGDEGGQLGPGFGFIMGIESPGEAEDEGVLGCAETALIAPSRRRRPKFI